jgi:N-acetyl-anhydromuramyl-L-alanine amidase AmpD
VLPFIKARNQGPLRSGIPVRLIVIHTMEAPEKPHTARNVALWFSGPTAPQASAHYCIDANETIQCVKEDVVAWAAPGANRDGIHIEHAGYARQNTADWSDDYSTRMLLRSASLAAEIAKRHNIPVIKLSSEDLKDRAVMGFCGHVDVTLGRMNGKGHTDPGTSFPWDDYLDMVEAAMSPTEPPPPGDHEA